MGELAELAEPTAPSRQLFISSGARAVSTVF